MIGCFCWSPPLAPPRPRSAKGGAGGAGPSGSPSSSLRGASLARGVTQVRETPPARGGQQGQWALSPCCKDLGCALGPHGERVGSPPGRFPASALALPLTAQAQVKREQPGGALQGQEAGRSGVSRRREEAGQRHQDPSLVSLRPVSYVSITHQATTPFRLTR